jgi:hypothetical protein
VVRYRPDLNFPVGGGSRPYLPPGWMTVHHVSRRHYIAQVSQTEILAAALDFDILDIRHFGDIRYRRSPVVAGVGGITGGDVIIDIYCASIDRGDVPWRSQHTGISVRVYRRIGLAPT